MEKPYICALIPKDQIFEEDEAAVHMQKQEELLRQANAEAAIKLDQEKERNRDQGDEENQGNGSLNDSNYEPYILENPFTRAVKMPHSKKKKCSP